ncbi:hypothetical protein HELRODRAFT_161175 [Helobdella robusta]|uniref:Solute carrier organic anion transporter family member n=1 Tax=Helobdella robusta TaxID=6412 RepID=T1ER69_HELRO|nr:hypothetical protein HELRODRAFT_161175 [Helobdella robusta]ESO01965.1 hypothetical protein HELRODRAFT_161175 [Helobdella robusta]
MDCNKNEDSTPQSLSVGERIVQLFNGLRKNIWTFIVLYFIFSFSHGVQGTYTSTILATLENNFNLPSSLSSIIIIVATLGYMSSAITVSFILTSKHHVRLFAVCMLVTGFCGLLYMLTHFIFKDSSNINEIAATTDLEKPDRNYVSAVCNASRNINESSESLCTGSNNNKRDIGPNYVALGMFVISEVFHGAAGACLWTVGLSFLDDNMPSNVAPKLIGIMYSVRFLSPVISSALGSVFLSLHTSLTKTSLTPSHPKWIGAWWLGFVICFLINTIISLPTFFLPQTFENSKKLEHHTKGSEQNLDDKFSSAKTASKVYHGKNLENFGLALGRLLRNPIYMLTTLGICFDCFIIPFYNYLPKYVEVHFKLTAWMASIIAVMVPSIAGGIFSSVGGFVIGKFKPSPDFRVTKNMAFSCVISFGSVLVLTAILFLQCPNVNSPSGYSEMTKSVSLTQTCNMNCSCLSDSFDPVCGDDNMWYASPCHAGCSSYATNGSMMYSDCSCINSVQQTAGRGYCDNSCFPILILYTIGWICFCSFSNLINVPLTNVTLKSVDEEDKSLALGLQLIIICVSVFPFTLIFGHMIDWTCILWKTTSCSDAVGSCLAYDHSKFRFIMHGSVVCVRIIACVFYILSFIFARRKLSRLQLEELKNLDIMNITPHTEK